MKSRIRKRHLGTSDFATFLLHCCTVVDSAIPHLRTAFLILGLIAAALRAGGLADVLFATGLLLQCSIWLENWLLGARRR